MVIDSSAVVAILFREPEAEWFEAAILSDAIRYMSVASLVESSIILDRHFGEKASSKLDGFVLRTGIEIVPVSLTQAEAARAAFRKFGRSTKATTSH